MVRLKDHVPASHFVQQCCFNSSMVRLKDIAEYCIAETTVFQFQYGTIERTKNEGSQKRSGVSIPVWYD